MMRRLVPLLLGVALLLGAAARAEAKVVHYLSQHPLPRKIGHGFCYIDVPHVHDFGPSDPRMYRDVNGELYFVGDPAPFDYEGPRYSFYGPHPVAEANVQGGPPVYCYLKGPHYHWYQPPPDAPFQFRGGAYWYTGKYDPSYFQERPRYTTVNEAYQPINYPRPVVDVTVAPPSFQGEIVAGFPGAPIGRATVSAPGVSAGVYIPAPPPPEVHIGIGIPAPTVVIGAPPVIIGAPPVIIGAPPVVIHDRREIYERHEYERHRGWERHEEHGHGWEHHEDRGHGWHGGPPPQQPHANGGWRGAPPQQQPHPAPAPQGGWRAPQGGGAHNKPQNGWRR